VIAFTITSRAYVPYARVLARTYTQHHPGRKLWALLIDDVHEEILEADEPFLVLRLNDLGVDMAEIHRMALLFGGKLIATIKPWALEHFISKFGEAVVYIDSDFAIFDSLDEMANAHDGVILVPHFLSALPMDGMDPDDTMMLGAGMFNAGMFGVTAKNGGFLEFFKERLRRECIFDPKKMRFNEQRWLDFVPSMFPYRVVRDPGIDVAWWNLHERPLSKTDDRWFVSGQPLRAFHFSSFDPRLKGLGGRYEQFPAPRIRVDNDPLFAQLCAEYGDLLFSQGFSDAVDAPFGFEMLPDGSPVYGSLRAVFRRSVEAADRGVRDYPPDPFDEKALPEFRRWAGQEYEAVGLSVPRRLIEPTDISTGGPGAKRGLARIASSRRSARRAVKPEEQRGAVDKESWAIDLLDRMVVDEAAQRHSTYLEILPDLPGFVCHGPRAPLSPGRYRVTLEFDGPIQAFAAVPLDQALVVEAFVEGYSVGSGHATFADLVAGPFALDVAIPEALRQAALFVGLDLRVMSRGRLHARLSALVLESVETHSSVVASAAARYDWLPIMAAGLGGRRAGVEVVAVSESIGVVVEGPNWRLLPGSYRATIGTRLVAELPVASEVGAMTAEVVAGARALARRDLTMMEISQGGIVVEFVVDEHDAEPDVQIGVRVQTVNPVDAVVTAVTIERLDDVAERPR
jgi:hypothetical protein